MKRILLLSILIIPVFSIAQEKKVLFLGNSYTYFNNLPKLVSDIADSKGDSMFYDSSTPGGHTLQGHTTNTNSISKIAARDWDYVILQEQSQRPSFPPSQVQTDVFPYAKFLDSLIVTNDSCTETMFYMTWGRKFGDQSNCQFYPPLCTYEGMQTRLRDSYVQMANDNDAVVAPVGIAFRNSIAADSNLNLYTADNSHPSVFGSYLAACVFYASIFHKPSLGGYHPSSVPSGTAVFLQNIADMTVFDSLSTWRIDTNKTINSDFNYLVNGMNVQFTDQSGVIGADHYWEFGDGSFSTDQDPLHSYLTAGTFNVEHTVSKNCEGQTTNKDVDIISTGISALELNSQIEIYPNPNNGLFRISADDTNFPENMRVYDAQGRLLVDFNSLELKGELNIESKGLHILHFEFKNGETLQQRIVVH